MARQREERNGLYQLSDEERIAVRTGMDVARRGEFASEEEMDEIYCLHAKGD